MKRLLSLLLCALLICNFVLPVYATDTEDSGGNTGEETVIAQTSENQNSGDQTTVDQTSDGEATGGQTADDQTAGDQTSGDQTSGDQTSGDQTAGDQTSGDQTAGDQTSGDQTSGDQTTGDQSIGNENTGDGTSDDLISDGSAGNSEEILVCNCSAAEGEPHLEGCPLYDPEDNNLKLDELIERLSACKTQAEKDEIFQELTEEQLNALFEAAPELFEYISSYSPAVNASNPGSLMPSIKFPALYSRARSNYLLSSTNEADSPLQLNKTSVHKEGTDDTYTITLEAYTTGTVSVSQVSTPCDIVLVLDESTSMTYHIGSNPVYELDTSKTYYVVTGNEAVRVSYSSWRGWYNNYTRYYPKTSASDTDSNHVQFYTSYQDRRSAIVEAVNAFLTTLREDNNNLPEGVTPHRVGMIGFSGINNARVIRPLATTSVNNISTSNLNANGGTYVHKGLEEVADMFDSADSTSGETRNRVVILFTDGEPGSGYWQTSNNGNTTNGDFGVAAEAINTAKNLKADTSDDGYGVTLYTVGIFPGADPSDTTSNGNKYMNAVSSNYKTASATSSKLSGGSFTVTWGDRADTGDYYLSASDSDTLTNIFEAIAKQTANPGIQLNSSTQIIDTVTQYFDIPTNASDITIQLADYDGSSFGSPYDAPEYIVPVIDASKNQISVSGFDFNNNFVASTGRDENDSSKAGSFFGRKIIISFEVTAKDEFWGGNNVPTNVSDSSGLYIPGDNGALEAVENGNFGTSPEVNVPIHVPQFGGQDVNIYLKGETPSASNLCDFELPTGDNAWKIAYVNVTGPTADKTVSNTEDTEAITITVTASPKYNGENAAGTAAQSASATATANVYVFKPVIYWKDSEINLGETANYSDNVAQSVEWVHGNQKVGDAGVVVTGTAPQLQYTYSPEAAAFTEDTPVKVTVAINGVDVTQYVTFYRNACTFDGCEWTEKAIVNTSGLSTWVNFIVHIKTFDLTIVKQGVDNADSEASFIFNIRCENTGIDMNVVIYGNGSVTIKGLPNGTYTVEEVGGYWRYEIDSTHSQKSQDVTPTGGTATVTFVNKKTKTQWLDDFARATNKFLSNSGNSASD